LRDINSCGRNRMSASRFGVRRWEMCISPCGKSSYYLIEKDELSGAEDEDVMSDIGPDKMCIWTTVSILMLQMRMASWKLFLKRKILLVTLRANRRTLVTPALVMCFVSYFWFLVGFRFPILINVLFFLWNLAFICRF